jgi:hypothetical protein
MWPAPSPLRAPQRTHVRGRQRRRYRPIRRSGHRHRPARFRGPEPATRSVDRSAAATVRSGLPDRQLQIAPARIEPARRATAMDAASDGDPARGFWRGRGPSCAPSDGAVWLPNPRPMPCRPGRSPAHRGVHDQKLNADRARTAGSRAASNGPSESGSPRRRRRLLQR